MSIVYQPGDALLHIKPHKRIVLAVVPIDAHARNIVACAGLRRRTAACLHETQVYVLTICVISIMNATKKNLQSGFMHERSKL